MKKPFNLINLSLMTTEKNKFFAFLKRNGLKPTSQRNLVVKQLLNGKDRHFTAEDLYEEMKSKKKILRKIIKSNKKCID